VFLVDTSVWIATFRRPAPLDLETIVPLEEVATCLPVIQEVLQGFQDERAFRTARQALLALPCVESPLPLEIIEQAVELCRSARRAGFTVRSSIDCIIAACALRHDLDVLHQDRDFDLLARVSGLRARTP